MTTKEQVTEYINARVIEVVQNKEWKNSWPNKWFLLQNWMSPEIAHLLVKISGETMLTDATGPGRIAKNRSNI